MSDTATNGPVFLTKVVVSYQLAADLRIRNSYDWHQRVWQCFPGRDDQARDFLTRLDDKDGEYQLLIVSPQPPTRPEWCLPESWATKPITATYFTHCRYAFQLRANPTKKVAVQRPDGSFTKNGRRVPLIEAADLRAWLARKGEINGFAVEQATMRPFGNQYFKKDGAYAPHFAVDFQGALAVTDAGKFAKAFRHGIGAAKAFGFGLLVIAPVP
jgi:CRISPR system Cascade subunit CasE